MRYQIQCVHLDEWSRNALSRTPKVAVLLDTADHNQVLREWQDYYSGLCDAESADPANRYWGEPHCNQNYSGATFYRIVAYDDGEEIREPTYEDSED